MPYIRFERDTAVRRHGGRIKDESGFGGEHAACVHNWSTTQEGLSINDVTYGEDMIRSWKRLTQSGLG